MTTATGGSSIGLMAILLKASRRQPLTSSMNKFFQHSSETAVSCQHRFVSSRVAERLVAHEERLSENQRMMLDSWSKPTQPEIPARKFQQVRIP